MQNIMFFLIQKLSGFDTVDGKEQSQYIRPRSPGKIH